MALDKTIFGEKTLSNLFEEIYDNSKETKGQVKALINELKPLIENIGDATLIVPMIKEYMEIGVKNDEQLLKLATIVQRLEAIEAKGGGGDNWEDMFAGIEGLIDESNDTVKALEQAKEENQEEEE